VREGLTGHRLPILQNAAVFSCSAGLTVLARERSLSPFELHREASNRHLPLMMDWLWLLVFLALLLIGATAYYYVHAFAVRTREAFRAAQPAIRITNVSAMTAGNVLTISPEIENVGRGVAYDCLLHMGGWEGNFAVKKVYPPGPRYQKHVASIVLGPDAPIRAKRILNGYVRLRYLDRWGLKYDCWYQVAQVESVATPHFSVQIDLTPSELNEPRLTVREMWKLLRTAPSYD